MALVDWSDDDKLIFLKHQFAAQHSYYQQQYADASFQLIVRDDRPLGRLYVARWAQEIRIVDIALLPEYRGFGIGTTLLTELIAESTRAGKPITIHVESFNPALRWYQRLGFQLVGDGGGVYLLLRRSATPLS